MEKTEATGERVGGYRVVRTLATGGTRDVLLATAEGPDGLERPVVLQRVAGPPPAGGEDTFALKAAAYARLVHPCIVRLHELVAEGEQRFMVLEHVEGPPLSRLRGMLKTVGQPPLQDAAAIHVAACLFDALAAAHAASDEAGDPAPVVHRDVNPAHVLLTWGGHVKLSAFAGVRVSRASDPGGPATGTYGYLAPEQVKGEMVTPRADVYAGAVILWEMLTRRRAFLRGALPESEAERALAEPRLPSIDVLRPDVDASVRDAVKRALEPRADKRTVTAEEMASILRAVVPAAAGSQKLASALALVRHEPHAARTSVPPPLEASDEIQTTKISPDAVRPPRQPYLPRPTPAPRPAAVVPRETPSDRAVETAPSVATEPERPLREAIDHILRDIPSDVPPNIFPSSEPPASAAPPEAPEPAPSPRPHADAATALEAALRPLGQLPAAPPPLEVARARPEPRPLPSSFPAMSRTLSMVDLHVPTDAQIASAEKAAGRAAPATASAPKPPAGPPAKPSSLPTRGAPPPGPAPRKEGAAPAASAATGAHPAVPRESELPPGGRSPARALAGVLLFAAVAVGAATFGYVRWQQARVLGAVPSLSMSATASPIVKATEAPPAVAAPAEEPTAAAREVVEAPAPASSASAPASSASAPASGASATPSSAAASGSAAPSTSSGAPTEAVPAGMGRVKTEGSAAGRRIFIDERTVGQTPEAVVVKCGSHAIKLGSTGSTQIVDVPCGAEITVGDR